jgi:hypothetical protein
MHPTRKPPAANRCCGINQPRSKERHDEFRGVRLPMTGKGLHTRAWFPRERGCGQSRRQGLRKHLPKFSWPLSERRLSRANPECSARIQPLRQSSTGKESVVPTLLSQGLPDALKSLRTRPLFVLREEVPPLLVVGQTPNAFRRILLRSVSPHTDAGKKKYCEFDDYCERHSAPFRPTMPATSCHSN